MFFDIALYVSLAIFGIGMIYKISTWFWRSIGIDVSHISTSERVLAAIKGILQTVCSVKILTLFKAFFLDVVLQIRVLKENFLRWLMHMLIYGGFILLLLLHALDDFVTQPLFPDYASTLNPFMFLRDLLGLLVIIGIGIAIYRRMVMKIPRLKTNPMDRYAVTILAIIMLSGILLEGTKITSYSRYQEMVEEYADTDEEEELKALESFWVKEYDVVSPNVKGPFDEDVLAQGAEMHEMSCEACHSRPGWAFTGYAVAKITKPLAGALDRAHIMDILWYIHFLACFLGLAYLPFSKMFHIFASPISLLANAVMDKESSDRANIATRQVMELDACTHCGTCSRRCSVAVAFHKFGNITILPSERMVFLKEYIADKDLDDTTLKTIQLGAYLCTNCDRCTVVCPVGINLRDLWFNVKEEVIQKDHPLPLVLTPYSFYRGVDGQALDPEKYSIPLNGARRAIADRCEMIGAPDKILTLTPVNREFKNQVDLSSQGDTYSYCFSCENCTTVCPVVQNYENPEEILSLLPHQIMRSLGLGLKDLALGSNMLWDCLTCYQCQEHCPQGVKVTDIFYELKNMAAKEIFPDLGD
ncbi:MAG: 4Fe-4S dicluster domain-containing protein [Deltaproteobacteria bacterium]|nr:4Fe-4S dicluster domain-containing protein [Deltaproteobacteria bacterium]